jgi:BirA family biotin operon repressor/biotin-[acetyl-CoA-carboxylase] ligase
VEALRQLGIEVDAVAGQGYRLKEPLELLDKRLVLAGVDPAIASKISSLYIESSIDSTNSALRRLPVEAQHAGVILAEYQSGGRGRRDRQWHSPYGRNIYLSLGWKFEQSLSELGCLPLVVALATAKALASAGLKGHSIKWPNDLILEGRKLCGCLVEIQGDVHGPCHAVMGVGVNVHMPATAATSEIDQPWTDVHSQLPQLSRNKLAGLLLAGLFRHIELFSKSGFEPFREDWVLWDGLKDRRIDVYADSGPIHGMARGIDKRGALLLDTGKEQIKLYSGDVSLNRRNI